MSILEWTKEYCRMSYYPAEPREFSNYRGSIANYGEIICAKFWSPGCGFSPLCETFTDVNKAKAAIETWYKSKVQPGTPTPEEQ
jgi:hypothetical protein